MFVEKERNPRLKPSPILPTRAAVLGLVRSTKMAANGAEMKSDTGALFLLYPVLFESYPLTLHVS